MIKTRGLSFFLPYLFLLLVIVIRFVLQDFVFFNDYTPFYEVIFIYSWAFIADFKWNIIVLALIGTVRDLLFLDPFGLSVIMFVVFAVLINYQKEQIENRGFMLSFVYFILSLLVIEMLRFFIMSFFLGSKAEVIVIASLKEMYFTIICYPLFCFIISLVMKKYADGTKC